MPAFSGQIAEGLSHHRAGRLDEAEAVYRAVLETRPQSAEALHLLGVLLCQRGDAAGGCELLHQAAKADPDCPEVHFNLAKALTETGQQDPAREAYRRALELRPDYPDALNNLGLLNQAEGRLDEARACYVKVLAQDPKHPEARDNLIQTCRELGLFGEAERLLKARWQEAPEDFETAFSLACLLRDQQKNQEAIEVFEQALALKPEDPATRYLLSVLRGENPEAPPADYITRLFDPYAQRFDQHLVHRLNYNAPEQLARLVRETRGSGNLFEEALDLGCGTGLSGLAFRSLCRRLTGVDLSSPMLERARAKGLYDRIAREELVTFLEMMGDDYDLFIATDVFIYLGNLAPLFSQVRRRCRPGAWFVFSTESLEDAEFEVRPSGRYAHSMFYIQNLADRYGFRVRACRDTRLREERGEGVPGHLFVLEAESG